MSDNTGALSDDVNMTKRLTWLDFAKFMAIAAVLVDHNFGLLYMNPLIQRFSFYSVSVFILAAGYAAELSNENKEISYKKQFRTLIRLFLCYALANIIGLFYYTHSLNGQNYLNYLLHFNLQGPYYYFAFFFQLIMITPFLVKLCEKCFKKKKLKWALHVVVICIFIYLQKWLVNGTDLFGIYGGGGRLLGGTYLLLYYLGIIFAREKVYEKLNEKYCIIATLLIGGAWIVWNIYSWNTQYMLDTLLSQYFGEGVNPPGATEMVAAILMFSACYYLDAYVNRVLRHIKDYQFLIWLRYLQQGVVFIGKNTIYIFLYHLMFLSYLGIQLNNAGITDIWIKRLVIYPGMLILPAVIGVLISKVVRKIQL